MAYVWYSKSSAESGKLLAGFLGAAHGTLPPTDFSGEIIAFGASVSSKFKWAGKRNISTVMNDPRRIIANSDRAVAFPLLRAAGITTPALLELTDSSNFASVASNFAAGTQAFAMCKKSGAGGRLVTNQAEYAEARTAGCVLALEASFCSKNKLRLFVVGGEVVGSLQLTSDTEVFIARAMVEAGVDAQNYDATEATLRSLLAAGAIKADKAYWAPYTPSSNGVVETAVLAATTLGLDFCAVDMVLDGPTGRMVLNVVTTPALVGHASLVSPLTTAFTGWLSDNTKTALQVLQEIAGAASEEEAAVIVTELKAIKARLAAELGTTAS